MAEQYWVYILTCEYDRYYTGYTIDLTKRFQQHVQGTGGCKFTRAFKPIRIAQYWKISGSKALAMKVERAIKKLTKSQKDHLIANPTEISQILLVLTNSRII